MTHQAGNNTWLIATVENIIEESQLVKTFSFRMPHILTHQAGQHFELRLTSENGYQAARLYSAATAGDNTTLLRLTIMDVQGGEVSPYLSHQLSVGDSVEIRGPFGKFFTWTPKDTQDTLLIGGGSGIVPMHAIYTSHKDSGSTSNMKVLYSAHSYKDILYKDAFLSESDVAITLTKDSPADWRGLTGRIDKNMIATVIRGLEHLQCYICGMSPFVDAVTDALIELGIPAKAIKTERFG